MIRWLAKLPSTNTRIAVTLVCVLATCVRYVGWGPPSQEWAWVPWLVFLGASLGLDTAHFATKRVTHREGSQEPTP
jgi:sterol desaturase/sphingolipid hydroxylase (fatty acid hydroxylase superfamily)